MRRRRSAQVQLVAMTGVGLTPTFAWATTGAKPRLFAYIYPGYLQLIEEGWQADANALEARQKQAEGEALVDLAKRLAPSARRHHADPQRARVRQREGDAGRGHRRAGLRGTHRVGAAGRHGRGAAPTTSSMPAARVLLPGLFDMHGHVGRWDGGLQPRRRRHHRARHGQRQRHAAADAWTRSRPARCCRRRSCPPASSRARASISARNGFVVKNLDEAKKAVDWYAEHGYPQIKIYNSFPKDILQRHRRLRARQGHARQRPRAGLPARAGRGATAATTRSSTSTR